MKPEDIEAWIHTLDCLRGLILRTFPEGVPTRTRMLEDLRVLSNGMRGVRVGSPGMFPTNAFLEAEKIVQRKSPPPPQVRAAWVRLVLE